MSYNNDGPAGSVRLLRTPESGSNEKPVKTSAEVPTSTTDETPPEVETFDAPTMGWPALQWKIVHALFPTVKPPKFSKKELVIREEAAEAQRHAELLAWQAETRAFTENRMRNLSDEMPGFTVAYVGVKGAAATTTTMVNASSALADVTRTTVYAADFNPASGTAGGRLGKDFDETISLREFGDMIEQIGDDTILTRAMVNAKLRPTRFGVRVLIADDYTLETTEQFGTRTRKMLNILEENCDYLALDTANDITTPASRAVLEKADLIVFTANVAEPDSLRLLYTSMEKVRQLGLRQKVIHSIVVISNLPKGSDLEGYRKYLNRTDLSHVVIQRIAEADFQGQFLGVPHDEVIAKAGKVELEAYAWETQQAYIDLVNAQFEQIITVSPVPSVVGTSIVPTNP